MQARYAKALNSLKIKQPYIMFDMENKDFVPSDQLIFLKNLLLKNNGNNQSFGWQVKKLAEYFGTTESATLELMKRFEDLLEVNFSIKYDEKVVKRLIDHKNETRFNVRLVNRKESSKISHKKIFNILNECKSISQLLAERELYCLSWENSFYKELTIIVSKPAELKQKIESFLNKYIEDFQQGNLNSNYSSYYNLDSHLKLFDLIIRSFKNCNYKNISITGVHVYNSTVELKKTLSAGAFCPLECFLYLEQTGHIKIKNLCATKRYNELSKSFVPFPWNITIEYIKPIKEIESISNLEQTNNSSYDSGKSTSVQPKSSVLQGRVGDDENICFRKARKYSYSNLDKVYYDSKEFKARHKLCLIMKMLIDKHPGGATADEIMKPFKKGKLQSFRQDISKINTESTGQFGKPFIEHKYGKEQPYILNHK